MKGWNKEKTVSLSLQSCDTRMQTSTMKHWIRMFYHLDNHRYKSAWVQYRRLNIGVPRRAKRCSRAPTHTYMWLASIIIENMLLMINFKNIIATKAFLIISPKIWITPDLIIPPTQLLLSTLTLPALSCYRLMSVTFKIEFVEPHLHCHLGFICSIQYRICVLFNDSNINVLITTNRSLCPKGCGNICVQVLPSSLPPSIVISPYRDRSACQAASTSAYRFFSEGFPELAP